MKLQIRCDWCGRFFEKESCRITPHNFCCRKCLADFSSKKKNPDGYATLKDFTNVSTTFRRLNSELNKKRMTPAVREKLRKARMNSGEGKTYTKFYGRHEHRVVAEQLLGRPLPPGEVVHHIDGNKRNNRSENLRVFSSQAEHAKFHAEFNWFINELRKMGAIEGGDAE